MITDVVLPKSGLTMTEGKIVQWLKKEGEHVEKGTSIALMETEKVTIEVEAPVSGTLLKIVAPVDSTTLIGDTIAYIGDTGDTLPETSQPGTPSPPSEAQPDIARGPARAESSSPTEPGIRATPKAKKLAKERSVEISVIRGTGNEGLINESDVLRHLEQTSQKLTKASPLVKQVIPLSETRKVIAQRLTDSLRTMAQVSIMYESDAMELVELRQRKLDKQAPGTSLSYTDILIKIVAVALRKYPIFNAVLDGEQIKIIKDINIGFAVSAESGLNVPVIKNAEERTLTDVSLLARELAEKTRSGKLTLDDVSGATFTISNLGMSAVDSFTPIINPPQVAILGVGRIIEKAVPVKGEVQVRPRLTLSLTFDHQVTDGFNAAEFLKEIASILESREGIDLAVGPS